MEFRYYLLRRLVAAFFAIFSVITFTFILIEAVPGNRLLVILGNPAKLADTKLVAEITKFYGLNQPIYVQYLTYMWNFLHGNLGYSSSTDAPVTVDLRVFFPATMELSIFAIFFALIIAIPIGVASATRRGGIVDHVGRVFSIVGVSGPPFWWGVLFLVVFYLDLGFVGSGRLSPNLTPPHFVTGFYTIDSLLAGNYVDFVSALEHLILPSLTLGLVCNAVMMRLTRSSMLEVLSSDYIAMARMKGVSERVIIYKHAFRNAIIPTLTYAGLLFGGLLGGAVLVETVFLWNGMGLYITNAIFGDDLQAVLGTTFILAVIFTVVNLIVDILYAVIDPRVRIE